MSRNLEWSADVVVVGYGFAGAAAAITAHDAGAEVVILEKAKHPGGLSIVSGGGLAVADDADAAFAYLQRTNLGTTPAAVNRALAQGMTELPAFLHSLEAHSDIIFEDARARIDPGAHSTYPFPGGDHIKSMKMPPSPSLPPFPWARGLRGGARTFRLFYDNVEHRRIPVHCETPAVRLIQRDGAVAGVVARRPDGAEVAIRARRAVILATGGFENDPALLKQYYPGQPVYCAAALTNTGDGLRLAQAAGADLWHMWHLHGSYGFKFPGFPMGFRHRIIGPRVPTRQMPWILVDKHGRRFMNEYPPASQDTPIRDLAYYDPDLQDYPRIPCFMILDDVGRATGPIALPLFQDYDEPYDWSDDNLKEVERGWIHQAGSIAGLADRLGLPTESLVATVDRWNRCCDAGRDDDFGRLPGTVMPLRTPPYFALECWPIVNNTQGGPVHDERQRVLDPTGSPIPRLYAVGELGSLFGHLYLEAGNVAECIVSGRTAGAEAAAAEPLDDRRSIPGEE